MRLELSTHAKVNAIEINHYLTIDTADDHSELQPTTTNADRETAERLSFMLIELAIDKHMQIVAGMSRQFSTEPKG